MDAVTRGDTVAGRNYFNRVITDDVNRLLESSVGIIATMGADVASSAFAVTKTDKVPILRLLGPRQRARVLQNLADIGIASAGAAVGFNPVAVTDIVHFMSKMMGEWLVDSVYDAV